MKKVIAEKSLLAKVSLVFVSIVYLFVSSPVAYAVENNRNNAFKQEEFISATKKMLGSEPVVTDTEHNKKDKSQKNKTKEQKVSKLISAVKGGCVKLGKASVEIPAGALDEDLEISITHLLRVEDTGETLYNAIPENRGYRFLPAGTKF